MFTVDFGKPSVPQEPGQLLPQPQHPVQLTRTPLPEQSTFYANYDYGSRLQHQYHVPPSVAQPPPQPADSNPYQPTASYPQHHVSLVASPQPQQIYYSHVQPWHHRLHYTPLQPLTLPNLQRFDNLNLNRHEHYLPPSPQSQFQPPLPITQHTDPVATQFQGARGVNISGNPRFTNIGMNTGNLTITTVNNYGVTRGLEELKEFVSFAALHDSSEQDPYHRCHPGTRENVLRQLRHWIDNPDPTDRIFWLHGPAGAGKSAIAHTIARAYKQGEVAATFFFYRSDPARNDGNRLFTTIAWQLAFSIPAVKDLIVHALDKTPHLPRKDVETQFEQLVAHPMNNITSQIPQLAPVIIIDGVDECASEQLQRIFLSAIGNAVKGHHVPLRFLICTRPEALIEEALSQFKDFTLRIDLATLEDANRDIEKYLTDQFFIIASKQGLDPSWPGQEIIQEIVLKSSGNFILASTLIRFIGDEDHDAESQLDIVRRLKPRGPVSPFALLDRLYLEILNRQLDQDFLKTFLALLVGRTSIEQYDLHKDDGTLMNVSVKELHTKLRRLRSLLKFEPFIDVHHKSFFDFLQDSSRSGQYYVSKRGGRKRYLELIVDSVVRHVSMAIEQPNCHATCRSSPEFKYIVKDYPPRIVLPNEDWQETLNPLLDLQDKLLNASKPQPCRVAQIMRDLLLQVVALQRSSPHVATEPPESSRNGAVTKRNPALVTETREDIPENDLDRCLSVLLSCLRETNSELMVNAAIIDCMSALLAFDYAEIAARVRSVSDAQLLIDFIDLLTNNKSFNQFGPDMGQKATYLASEIFARVPVLPRSFWIISNGPSYHIDEPLLFLSRALESGCQTALIGRILDQNYIVPLLREYGVSNFRFDGGNVNEHYAQSSPLLVTKIRTMLKVARTIRYIHSMDIGLCSMNIKLEHFALDSNHYAKVRFKGLFAWWVKEALVYGHEDSVTWADFTHESNISAFGLLFDEVCFEGQYENPFNSLVRNAKELIKRCRAKDTKSRPTMEGVVKEMETWDLA